MRILHLAYEDPLQPGSGGGSIRAREINRRLADRHEITALVAGYPGAKPRVEDGVRWVPIGPRSGTKLDRLAYFPLLGPEVARRPHDLVVEEFGAPFSVGLSPLFTRRPVVASVQWLFASQMREKYRLPFDRVEQHGLRFYDRFIAVSGWLAEELRARRPGAGVEVIPNGVEEIAFEAKTTAPRHLLFVGRLDLAHKGGDFLFEILARVRRARGGRVPPLVILGEGPDRAAMEKLAKNLGLSDVVDFRGRVEGPEKYRLMAEAYAVLMPSRHETFGMVAAESLAAGGPLVTFDVGPLREVVGGEAGVETGARLVPPYDLDAFAREVVRLVDDPALAGHLREGGRSWAHRYDWEELAVRQEECYLRAATASGKPSPRAPRGGAVLRRGRPVPRRAGGARRSPSYRSVALVGIDGAGKSTQTELLHRLLNGPPEEARVFAVHPFGRKLLRVGVEAPILPVPAKVEVLREKPRLLRRLVAAADILDIVLYLWLVHARAALAALFGDREVWMTSDRSVDDVLLKHRRLGTLSEGTADVVRRLAPGLEKTVWLRVEPKVAMARDGDFDLAYYEQLHAAYEAAAARFGWSTVDAGRAPEEVHAGLVEELGLDTAGPPDEGSRPGATA